MLPNMRLILLPSEMNGNDWLILQHKIDRRLEELRVDLAEEAVYFIFNESNDCLIGRSVIGPKKAQEPPFVMEDWVAAPVWREELQGESLDEFLGKAQEVRQKAKSKLKKLSPSYFLRLRRKLDEKLETTVEVIFHE